MTDYPDGMWTGDGIYHRLLTNRERARAQGFPERYVFHGNQNEVRQQIGNAVSVNVAQFLGHRVAESLGDSLRGAA